VLRSAASLDEATRAATEAGRVSAASAPGARAAELRNLATMAHALAAAARARTESRGAHARTDFPALDEAQRLRYVAR
jgi:L-aspartate oxidase